MHRLLPTIAARFGLPAGATEKQVVAAIDRRHAKRRDSLVAAAVADGRIHMSSAAGWRKDLDDRGLTAEAQLEALSPAVAVTAEQHEHEAIMATMYGIDVESAA